MDSRTTALIVIDAQVGFVNRYSQRALPAIVRLVRGWQAASAPVVMTRFRNPVGSPYEMITGWERLRTAEEQAIADDLVPYVSAAKIINKGQSSIFTPEGSRLIREGGWTDLVMCGIDTDACVYDSAIAAYHGGYRPWIVTDACASSGGPEYHDAALLLAARNIGASQLVTSEVALSLLGGTQGVPA